MGQLDYAAAIAAANIGGIVDYARQMSLLNVSYTLAQLLNHTGPNPSPTTLNGCVTV